MFTSYVKLGQLIYLICAGDPDLRSYSLVIYEIEWSQGPVYPQQGPCQVWLLTNILTYICIMTASESSQTFNSKRN